MTRLARIMVSGAPPHVTQRGNNRQDVFFGETERHAYLQILTEECTAAEVTMRGIA